MILFSICISIFLLILLYLAIALSSILRWRTKAEGEEFAMRREFLVLCGFAEGVVSYIPSEIVKDRREAVLGARSIQMMALKGEELIKALDNIYPKMSQLDQNKFDSIKLSATTNVTRYNSAVIVFNKKINNIFIKLLAKRLKVKPMKEIGKE